MSDLALIKYDAACRALSEAKSVDEVKKIRDTSEALRAYAKQAKNKQLEVDAAEIRIRAERRVGELIQAQKQSVGLNKGAKGSVVTGSVRVPVKDTKPTLADAGIDKKLSARAQQLAAVPEKKFNEMISGWRDRVSSETERVTTNLLREGQRIQTAVVSQDSQTVKDLALLPDKHFGTIYADPPWLYGNQGTRAATSNHYDGMTVDEIAALPIGQLAATDAHLHLWTTNAFLFEAKRIIEAWGFEYKSILVWVKPQMGIGNYWRLAHEFLVLGVRGSCPFRDRSQMSWIKADRTRHSEKPSFIRETIEVVSPGPYLELFGRSEVKGWTVWGNEISRGLQLDLEEDAAS